MSFLGKNSRISRPSSIPIPKEFIEQFKCFVNNSKSTKDYNFLFNLDQIHGGSIWIENADTMNKSDDEKAPTEKMEKPIGMKTIDRYFIKKSNKTNSAADGKNISPNRKCDSVKSLNDTKVKPSSNSCEDNEEYIPQSQDMFDEYNRVNEATSLRQVDINPKTCANSIKIRKNFNQDDNLIGNVSNEVSDVISLDSSTRNCEDMTTIQKVQCSSESDKAKTSKVKNWTKDLNSKEPDSTTCDESESEHELGSSLQGIDRKNQTALSLSNGSCQNKVSESGSQSDSSSDSSLTNKKKVASSLKNLSKKTETAERPLYLKQDSESLTANGENLEHLASKKAEIKKKSELTHTKGSDTDSSTDETYTVASNPKENLKLYQRCSSKDVKTNRKVAKSSKCEKKDLQNHSSDSSSEDNDVSFKNLEIGKMLGLNETNNVRNMSCRAPDKPQSKESSRFLTHNHKDSKINKDENSIFAPAASSSFMIKSPRILSSQTHLNLSKDCVKRSGRLDDMEDGCNVSDSSVESDESLSHSHSSLIKNQNISHQESLTYTKIDDVNSTARDHFPSNSRPVSKRKPSQTNTDLLYEKPTKKPKTQISGHVDKYKLDFNKDLINSESIEKSIPNNNEKTWLLHHTRGKKLLTAEERLNSEGWIAFESISSDDEIYTLQCPKELDIHSLVGNKISLTDESLFDGRTKDGSVMLESFAMNLESRINLLLPSKKDSTFKIGNYKVNGSIIVSEHFQAPMTDMAASGSFKIDLPDVIKEKPTEKATPLPKGLKIRHPLYGLDYNEKGTSDLKEVNEIEKILKKMKKKEKYNAEDKLDFANEESSAPDVAKKKKKKKKTDALQYD